MIIAYILHLLESKWAISGFSLSASPFCQLLSYTLFCLFSNFLSAPLILLIFMINQILSHLAYQPTWKEPVFFYSFPLFHSINYQDFSLISYNFLPGPRFYSSILKFGRLLFISNFSARSKSCWQSPIFFIWILYYHSISVFQMTSPMS